MKEDRVKRLGPTHIFRTIAPHCETHIDTLRTIVEPAAWGLKVYEPPQWEDEWAKKGSRVLELKDEIVGVSGEGGGACEALGG